MLSQLGEPYGEAMTLRGLAELHDQLEQYEMALDYCNRSLSFAKKWGLEIAEDYAQLQ